MKALIADQFREDPRVLQAKKLLLEALDEHQKKITDVQGGHADLLPNYEQLLDLAKTVRGAPLWHPYVGSGIGNGPYVELADGSVKIDFINGIGPHPGHSVPLILESAFDAALDDVVMQGNLQQNRDGLIVADKFAKAAGLDHCFLTTSGAMACENGLKIALCKGYPRHRILAFNGCFTGRTLALSRITDKPAYRLGLPETVFVDYVPFYDPNDPKGSTERAVKQLKEHLHRYTGEHAAMMFELVQGEGGFNVGSHDFFVALMDICKEHNVAVIADEVQTFGRTPQLFAFQHFELQDHVDIVTIGKFSQLCATLFNKEWNPKPGIVSQTYTASCSMIHASEKILDELLAGDYFGENGKNARLHRHFEKHLVRLSEKFPHAIRGPFGMGMMIGFTPLNGTAEQAVMLVRALFEAGLICFIAGRDPVRIRFLPPVLATDEKTVDRAMNILEQTLETLKL